MTEEFQDSRLAEGHTERDNETGRQAVSLVHDQEHLVSGAD